MTSRETRAGWYGDACGAAHGLELVGERWALLVVRELIFGPRRFGELRAGLPGISANALTQRLAGLESAGIVARRKLPSPANAQVYELTAWGYQSEPVFIALGRWAARSPSHDPTLPISASSVLLSFRTMFDAKRAKDFEATIGLRLDGEDFWVRVRGGELTAGRGEVQDAGTVMTTEPAALAAVVYAGRSLGAAVADGSVTVTGQRAVAKRFVTLFRLPPKAA